MGIVVEISRLISNLVCLPGRECERQPLPLTLAEREFLEKVKIVTLGAVEA